MAKITIKRKSRTVGSAVKHEVYLNNKFLGILKNKGTLNFDAPVGPHTLYFNSASKLYKKNTSFRLNVNEKQEEIEILTKFNAAGEYVVEYADNLPHAPNFSFADVKGIQCPNCGSNELATVSESYTTGKDFNSSNACCGYFLCGPLGLLLGVDKKGKQQHTDNFWVCKKCGNKFKM